MYEYRNTFHNTTARSKYTVAHLEEGLFIAIRERASNPVAAAARRIRTKLCPAHKSGCTCGDWIGRRG